MKTTTLRNALLAAAVFAALPAHAQDKVAKIGILAPLTGGAAADGTEMVNGAKLAAEEMHNSESIAERRAREKGFARHVKRVVNEKPNRR